MLRLAFAMLSLVTVVGCASQSKPETLSCCHPANPSAAVTPMPPTSTALMLDEAAPASPAAPTMHDHAAHGQSIAAPATSQPGDEKAVYTCPMHPEVTSDKPGNCPKCGMKLAKKKN